MTVAGESLSELLEILRQRRGVDFRDYRPPTLLAGLRARIAATGAAGEIAYRERLLADPLEPERLARAMLLHEHCEGHPGLDWELLASDVDEAALGRARRGLYPAGDAAAMEARRRARFLRPSGSKVLVAQALRLRVRFALHQFGGPSLAPPEAIVASFPLLLLRNVLIYFDARLQERAAERLPALVPPGGALVLGDSEELPGAAAERFEPWPGLPAGLPIRRRRDDGAAA